MCMKTHSEIIDAFGGTSAVSAIFEISSPSVSEWRTNGIPKARLMYLQLLRPDLFATAKRTHPKSPAEQSALPAE